MSDIKQININGTSYDIKDETARNDIESNYTELNKRVNLFEKKYKKIPLLAYSFGLTFIKNITPVTVGINPRDMCFDGSYIYVANYGSGTVSIINATSHLVVDTVTVGTNPWGVCFDGSYIYVANQGNGTVSIINARG